MTAGQTYTQDIASNVYNPENNECGGMALVPQPNFTTVIDNTFVHKPTLEDVGTLTMSGFINDKKNTYKRDFFP
jgi:hypothetical protein